MTIYQTTPTPPENNGQPCDTCLGYTSYHFNLLTDTEGYVDSAAMQLNPDISTTEALQTAVSHEVSHTLGLGDCDNCQSLADSLMYPAPSMNFTTTYYPTGNDMYAQFEYTDFNPE